MTARGRPFAGVGRCRGPSPLTEIAAWAQQHLSAGTPVVSDGLACFNGVTAAGCAHEPVLVGSGKAAVERPEFRWVNTIERRVTAALDPAVPLQRQSDVA